MTKKSESKPARDPVDPKPAAESKTEVPGVRLGDMVYYHVGDITNPAIITKLHETGGVVNLQVIPDVKPPYPSTHVPFGAQKSNVPFWTLRE